MRTPVALVRGQGVQREERRYDPDGFTLSKLRCDADEAQLALRIEPVARLDLDGGAAPAHQRVQSAAGLFKQFRVGRGIRFSPR